VGRIKGNEIIDMILPTQDERIDLSASKDHWTLPFLERGMELASKHEQCIIVLTNCKLKHL
jgi:hypothetical protein